MKAAPSYWIYYILLIAICGVVIFANSFIDPNGFLSPDSSNYLRLSERIIDGHLFTVPNGGRPVASDVHFAVWPIGYPALISALAAIIPIGTFLASKILNLVLLSLAIFALFRTFSLDGLAASLILMTAGTLTNFSMTWSEAPFTLAIILLSLHLGAILSAEQPMDAKGIAYLVTLLIGAFLSRYIGLFGVWASLIVGAVVLKRGRRSDAIKIVLSAMIALLFAIIYLAINKLLSGYATGMPRIPAPEGALDLWRSLLTAIVREFALPLIAWNFGSMSQNLIIVIWILALMLVASKCFRAEPSICETRIRNYCISFVIVGSTYLASIIFSRFTTQFDEFSFRLLDPGFALIFLGLALYIFSRFSAEKKAIYLFLSASMVLSVSTQLVSLFMANRDGQGYLAETQSRKAFYADIPDGSIVLFASHHLNYLRPSVHIAQPTFRPCFAHDEAIDDFLATLDWSRAVYVETGNRRLKRGEYHKSVQSWLNAFPRGKLLPIGRPNRPLGARLYD